MPKPASGQLAMLIIDDDERYVDALYRDGQRQGIVLRHAASLEEGQRIFESPEGGLISGIILDVECYRRIDQEAPDSSFIIAATKYFNEKAADLPLVAITGVANARSGRMRQAIRKSLITQCSLCPTNIRLSTLKCA